MSTHKHQEYWLLAEAKNRFSEVARSAVSEGPQKIQRRDGNVVVISERDYYLLKGEKEDFKNFLINKTPDLSNLDLKRDDSSMRDIEL